MADRNYEDELMDVQSSLVSLCLEALGNVGCQQDARAVYVYASLEEGMSSFNAFFRLADGSLPSLDDLVTDDDLYMRVCELAYDDLDRLRRACSELDRPCPTEIRGRYCVASGSYSSRCSYDLMVGRDDGTGRSPSVIFRAWLDDVAAGRDDLAEDDETAGTGADEGEGEAADGGSAGAGATVDGAPVVADDAAYGGFVVSNNVLAGVPARFAVREPSDVPVLNGWTVYSDLDDDAYVSDPGNFSVVAASSVARLAPALLDAFDAPYGTDIALLYDGEGRFAGYWDNEGEREVTLAQVLEGEARAS